MEPRHGRQVQRRSAVSILILAGAGGSQVAPRLVSVQPLPLVEGVECP